MRDQFDDAMDRIVETFSEVERVEFFSPGKPNVSFLAIYHEPSTDFDLGSTGLTSTNPMLTVRKDDVGLSFGKEDRLRIKGREFSIKDLSRDGYGNITLELYES